MFFFLRQGKKKTTKLLCQRCGITCAEFLKRSLQQLTTDLSVTQWLFASSFRNCWGFFFFKSHGMRRSTTPTHIYICTLIYKVFLQKSGSEPTSSAGGAGLSSSIGAKSGSALWPLTDYLDLNLGQSKGVDMVFLCLTEHVSPLQVPKQRTKR